MTNILPTYYISHGGGPWPWIPNMRAAFANLETSLVNMVASWPEKPKAILMVSGHWEEPSSIGVMANPNPPMVYDYYGFPPETYEVQYPAPGAPDLAKITQNLLQDAGLSAHLDTKQGFDHGTFAPMAIMYPNADIPVYQISLLKSYDPQTHIKMGRALRPLREQGVMIIGSGLSYHNLRMFGPEAREPSKHFDQWLGNALNLPEHDRTKAIIKWEDAPYARTCHKEEDHLAPLFVALGAAEDETATRVYHDTDLMGGITASSYRFGAI